MRSLRTQRSNEIKPNGGVRREIGTALVQFELSDPNPTATHARAQMLSPETWMQATSRHFLASIEGEDALILRDRKQRLVTYLTVRVLGKTQRHA